MQKLLIIIFCLMGSSAFAQQQFKVTMGKQSKTLIMDGKAAEYTIKKSAIKTGNVVIAAINPAEYTETIRSFMLVNDADAELYRIKNAKTKNSISLKSLAPKLQSGKTYRLYTISIPSDPAKAALVRVRRILVATITII